MSKKKMSLKELDFNNMGSWPKQFQLGFCVVVFLLILLILWQLVTSSKRDVLAGLELEEVGKRKEFEDKQGQAANLEPLKQQLTQMEQQLQQMLRQLPSRTEMPDLIVDISQAALASGIQNDLFEPQDETVLEFYAEKPIKLKMVGTYHQFGAFVSSVASLPRVVIMTMHDISLKPRGANGQDKNYIPGPNSPLELEGTIKTYRYRDEEEEANANASAGSASPAPAPAAAAPTQGGSR